MAADVPDRSAQTFFGLTDFFTRFSRGNSREFTESYENRGLASRKPRGVSQGSKANSREETSRRLRPEAVETGEKRVSSLDVMKRDMNTNLLAIAAQLSDDALRAKVKVLAQRSHEVTVELIAHLAVLEVRKLHCSEGPGSLFRYCTEILRFSEAAACNRIKAARAARKFPVILDLLADGSVNLTTVRLLAPHLRPENRRAILAEATGMTRRQVDKLVARLAPQPDVPASIRKLPAPTVVAAVPATVTQTQGATAERPTNAAALPPAVKRPAIAPLSPERYRVQFSAPG